MERITFAAIKINNCIIFGKDHAECIKRAVKEFKFDTPIPTHASGFLTNHHQFVSRIEARGIAVLACQVPIERNSSNRVFISEEIWHNNEDWYYDEDQGYKLKE